MTKRNLTRPTIHASIIYRKILARIDRERPRAGANYLIGLHAHYMHSIYRNIHYVLHTSKKETGWQDFVNRTDKEAPQAT